MHPCSQEAGELPKGCEEFNSLLKTLSRCLDIWADYPFTEVSPGHSWSSECSSDSASLSVALGAACTVLRHPQQSPYNLHDLAPRTGLTSQPQQHRKAEVSYIWSPKSFCSLVTRGEAHAATMLTP